MTDPGTSWHLEKLTRITAQKLLPELRQVDLDTMGETWSDGHWLREMPHKWEMSRVACMSDGSPVGFLVASVRGNALHVHRVAVAKHYRGTGLGTFMLRDAAKRARDVGLTVVSLKVNDANVRARSLYARLGFTVAGRTRDDSLMVVPCAELELDGSAAG